LLATNVTPLTLAPPKETLSREALKGVLNTNMISFGQALADMFNIAHPKHLGGDNMNPVSRH
jgi:hypothetical protein